MSTATSVYEPVIGLEVHAQLHTQTKMFCPCPADYQQAPPNTQVCPVCLGLPGSLPVINREAVRMVIMTGLALGSTIPEETKFDRKNYPYPDLMKGYQISQYDRPLCVGGHVDVEWNGGTRRVGMIRIHLEEDVAKLSHRTDPFTGASYSLLDVNRSGVPLMEMVSRPDLRSAAEARQFLTMLRSILQYLGVSTGNMEEGSLRCDANVSIRPWGSDSLPAGRVEIKNMNSFRSVQQALEFEVRRQSELVGRGERVPQETRGWLEEQGLTYSLRSKEEAHDYRYFPEPDLPPLRVDPSWVQEIATALPELAEAKRRRFIAQFSLPAHAATTLTATPATASFFEETMREMGNAEPTTAKAVANWTISELGGLLHAAQVEIADSPLRPHHLAELLLLLRDGTVGTPQAKRVLEESFRTGRAPTHVVQDLGLTQITDADAITVVIQQAIQEHPKAVEDFKGGKDTAVKYLVGQVMKATRGKANPSVVVDLLREALTTGRR